MQIIPPGPTVKISSGLVPMTFEALIDLGAMTEDQARARGWQPPPRVRTPIRRRLWWWVLMTWHQRRPRLHFRPCDHSDCD